MDAKRKAELDRLVRGRMESEFGGRHKLLPVYRPKLRTRIKMAVLGWIESGLVKIRSMLSNNKDF